MAEEAKKKPDAAPPADKGEEKKDGHGEKAAGGGMAGMLTKLPVMLGAVMIIEAVVLFAGFKFLGGGAPRSAAGAELVSEEGHGEEAAAEDAGHGEEKPAAGHGEAASGHGEKGDAKSKSVDKKKSVEIELLSMKAPNKISGRTFLYDVSMFVSTKGANLEKIQATIKDREALIKDRVRTIIAQSDPEKLGGGSEPGLETLRRQVKYQLDEIVGEGLIDEVLVPRCIPYRTDY
jgi:flagellar basal body-associated protein FliL